MAGSRPARRTDRAGAVRGAVQAPKTGDGRDVSQFSQTGDRRNCFQCFQIFRAIENRTTFRLSPVLGHCFGVRFQVPLARPADDFPRLPRALPPLHLSALAFQLFVDREEVLDLAQVVREHLVDGVDLVEARIVISYWLAEFFGISTIMRTISGQSLPGSIS